MSLNRDGEKPFFKEDLMKEKNRIYKVQVVNPEGEVIYEQEVAVNKRMKLKFMPSGRAVKDAIKAELKDEARPLSDALNDIKTRGGC
jgi:hypothetical protein